MTGHDELLEALGAVFGRAVSETASFDEAEEILMGLDGIRPQHIQTLKAMHESMPPSLKPLDHKAPWEVREVAKVVRAPEEQADRLINALVGAGFVSQVAVGYGGEGFSYKVNDLGLSLLAVLSEYRKHQQGKRKGQRS